MKIIGQAAVTRPVIVPKPRRKVVDVVLWILVVPAAVWAVARLSGSERGPLVQFMAFTPYVAGWSLLPVVLAVAGRRWTTAVVAAIVVVVFAAIVLPRARTGDQGPSAGVALHVMTSNMYAGGADPATVVKLVRENDVAVLAVQEFTPAARKALTDAGLDQLLPYASLADTPDYAGSGVYSRFPVTGAGWKQNLGGFRQAYATIQPPGAAPLLIESAHPLAPSSLTARKGWQTDLANEPEADPNGPPRILLGDFNATLDHASLRALIATGYRDAADATGKGLAATWPYYGQFVLPRVTIDHVLVDKRIGVRETSAHRIPRTDHRALIASLTVPAA
ncbi:endonuclease/exonuclease/phosphatase family metal-dependent hydrolase [Actinoplanes tereljensis]|uniref:Endonuclease n=1 Tax=Paractinoplanes tereljensis TaxID=571912 RepID=A0A919TQZ4_9ACTN|nr:endonuclease/exonuclease/phosphatase family protein [Actinoplanes tereljensis]GIF18664.1 endonuclease [Actinoplanes tereljensis]